MSEAAVLRARDLRKAFGRNEVLRGVDLDVGTDALVAIVGENGSGKSTLLRILAGELTPDAGTVEIDGRLGYCPQQPVLHDGLTVHQHIAYFAAAYHLASTARAEQLTERLGYERYLHTPAGELSGGTRQKLNLTLALMHDPQVLLLDEPYQGFDWETYQRFWKLVEDLRVCSRAIVVISHLVFEEHRFGAILDLRDGALRGRELQLRHPREATGV
jgi:ABC-type multidrug transport system ATPase subunit